MFTKKAWLNKIQAVADWACAEWHKGALRYGNSQTKYPCCDKPIRFISCDRGASRALYELGLTDQGNGGTTTLSMYRYLPSKGFRIITNFNDIQEGDIVEMDDGRGDGPRATYHVFIVKARRGNVIDKWDFGSDARISQGATFNNVPINGGHFEWGESKNFWLAWRPNYDNNEFVRESVNFSLKTCKKGDNGANVRLFKRLLYSRGYLTKVGNDVNMFDSDMMNAVINFQKSCIKNKDVRVKTSNGIIDAGTARAIISI